MTLVVDGVWGTLTTIEFQKSLKVTADGILGPVTWKAFQTAVGITADGIPGPNTYKALQTNVGATVDGILGPETVKKLQEHLNAGKGWVKVTSTTPTPTGSEADHTPNIITPGAVHFPAWIRYEEKLDQQYLEHAGNWNRGLAAHYGEEYLPVESHTHWWGEPGSAGTHDGNVAYLNSTPDVSANYVVSAGRVTLTVPLNKVALTTGSRNPKAWKTENDPLITTATDGLGYRTLGFLHYIVEKLNPSLLGEPIRLHKEFYSTSCSGIDVSRVRAVADAFRTGALDPSTGLPPVAPDPEPVPDPEPEPEPTPDPEPVDLVCIPRTTLDLIRASLAAALEAIDETT
jgi:peptidoglycan hydrolase-like protein with peptidoglycan-binding domain